MGELIYLKDVVTLKLDREKCVGCGMCLVVCPHEVLSMNNGHARIKNRDLCMECGACAGAVINAALGRDASSCGCIIEPDRSAGNGVNESEVYNRPSCC
jgi:ferredoxin